jgi:hypothetical protein
MMDLCYNETMSLQKLSVKYKECLHDKRRMMSLVLSLVALAFAFGVNFYAVTYVNANASGSVTDLILSNTRVYDLDGIFVNGAMTLVLFIALVCLWEPKRIPFTIKTISLFIIIRSIFITLTHIGAFPTHILIDPGTERFLQDLMGQKLFSSLFLGNDFFFSGHTGLPFLMAFLYYDNKWLRWIFIATSIFFGVVVLLTHLHYSIDVLSAFFIAYGIYRMSRILFKKDMPVELGKYT